ncbi:SDR family oxidoreductase [Actinoplanes derwentensis]|uniref:2-deoxy-D-gluconate 3-dehydrogenase n=1 Tax=Actinoplanes derwentensis TaxID=113562 RepID=A0A1H1Z4X7_9ACTN|nr:SDR family oxidoreductase [Actinoplanes derwentensis]GID81430.1 2-deoxy-D-gluconate 3-dehydrogenase [Actinoplanes derwentensis]SDT28677.1 2-deoxy-D-gluconate 3-dehydrogenase [Actinoplanes derwentensis]
MVSFRLDGRVALVTGGNRGLGQACADALAEAGASVIAVGSKELDLATADLRGYVDGLDRLDILVNNAGIIRRTDAVDVTDDDWDDVFTVNVDAAFRLSQAAGRRMLAQGSGKIINIASMLSFQGGVRVPAYTASKHAILGLTKALANEWAGRGVNVNAIAPGYMATDNTAALRDDPVRSAAILDRIPAGRWGEPDDLKGAVVFLASDAARYVHGTVIPVDGGWLAR